MCTYSEFSYDQHLSQVVDLLNRNLDERITKNFFKWKHLENPFGESRGVIAIKNGSIIGVKMLMRWEFIQSGTVAKALRPVDTTVEENQRGKGVFREMSKKLKQDYSGKIDIVFNTPNANSLIPNLKSGWCKLETNLHFNVGIALPKRTKIEINEVIKTEVVLEPYINKTKYYLTNISEAYLLWRYRDKEYRCMEIKKNNRKAYVYFKLRKKGSIKMLIICQIVGDTNYCAEYINALCFKLKCFVVYYLDNPFLEELGLLVKIKRKPADILYYEIGEHKLNNNLIFSLGDVEGKL